MSTDRLLVWKATYFRAGGDYATSRQFDWVDYDLVDLDVVPFAHSFSNVVGFVRYNKPESKGKSESVWEMYEAYSTPDGDYHKARRADKLTPEQLRDWTTELHMKALLGIMHAPDAKGD